MTLSAQIPLGTRVGRALARIAIDRVGESLGCALPRTAEQIADPEVLNALIREYRPEAQPDLPAIRRVRLPGVFYESSNCTNFRLDVDFERPSSAEGPLPRSLYVKLPCSELGTRAFANAVGFWEVEFEFCARVAGRCPIRVPRVFAAARRGSRFVLLLENLEETPGTRLFVNRDMAQGTTIERARQCLATLAALHSAHWGWPPQDRNTLIPPTCIPTWLREGVVSHARSRRSRSPRHTVPLPTSSSPSMWRCVVRRSGNGMRSSTTGTASP